MALGPSSVEAVGMDDGDETAPISRRRVLQASAAATVPVVATGRASAVEWPGGRCPEATLEPSMGPCAGASMEGCADDHPATVELRQAVEETLTDAYPDASALLEAGFKPYFDTLDTDTDGWSHWLQPASIGDRTVLDPDRPESVLVDNDSWRSIGVMFIATHEGEPVEPPAVYEAGDEAFQGPYTDLEEPIDVDRDHHERHDDHEGDPDRCAPWHYHAGLPGRAAWWFYRQAYETDFADGEIRVPCRTPCMMHVWTVDHPEGPYAHGGPPAESRDLEPAEEDLDTDAEPGEDPLDWDAVPESERPDDLGLF